MLKKDGWYLVSVNGSHHKFKHPVKKGIVTVAHPQKDFTTKTLKKHIQTGWLVNQPLSLEI